MKLYEIAKEIRLLELELEKEDGVIPADLAARMDALEVERQAKIGGVSRAFKNYVAESDAIECEIRALKRRKDMADKRAEWLRNYLTACMPNREEYADGAVKITWRSSSSTELLVDPKNLPKKYQRIEIKADIMALKADLAAGSKRVAPFIRIHEKDNIQIK